MPIVFDKAKARKVKNLGYILRNWKEIESFTVADASDTPGYHDAYLVAHFKGGKQYFTLFASYSVLHTWLDRPVFRGLLVRWLKQTFEIGSPQYRRLDPVKMSASAEIKLAAEDREKMLVERAKKAIEKKQWKDAAHFYEQAAKLAMPKDEAEYLKLAREMLKKHGMTASANPITFCHHCGYKLRAYEEPDEGDYIIYDERRGKTGVSEVGGKHLGTFEDQDEAEDFIRKHAQRDRFWPNVWWQSDHGNNHLLKDFWRKRR